MLQVDLAGILVVLLVGLGRVDDVKRCCGRNGVLQHGDSEGQATNNVMASNVVKIEDLHLDVLVEVAVAKVAGGDDQLLPDWVEVVLDDLALVDLDEFSTLRLLAEGVVGVALPDRVLLVEVGRAEVDLDCLLLRGGLLGNNMDFRSS